MRIEDYRFVIVVYRRFMLTKGHFGNTSVVVGGGMFWVKVNSPRHSRLLLPHTDQGLLGIASIIVGCGMLRVECYYLVIVLYHCLRPVELKQGTISIVVSFIISRIDR